MLTPEFGRLPPSDELDDKMSFNASPLAIRSARCACASRSLTYGCGAGVGTTASAFSASGSSTISSPCLTSPAGWALTLRTVCGTSCDWP